LRAVEITALVKHAYDLAVFDNEFFDYRLSDVEIFLVFHRRFHCQAVELLVALHAGGLYRRALGGVKQAEMRRGFICDFTHLAAQRVDFLDQLSLGQAPDCRVARHQRNRI